MSISVSFGTIIGLAFLLFCNYAFMWGFRVLAVYIGAKAAGQIMEEVKQQGGKS